VVLYLCLVVFCGFGGVLVVLDWFLAVLNWFLTVLEVVFDGFSGGF